MPRRRLRRLDLELGTRCGEAATSVTRTTTAGAGPGLRDQDGCHDGGCGGWNWAPRVRQRLRRLAVELELAAPLRMLLRDDENHRDLHRDNIATAYGQWGPEAEDGG